MFQVSKSWPTPIRRLLHPLEIELKQLKDQHLDNWKRFVETGWMSSTKTPLRWARLKIDHDDPSKLSVECTHVEDCSPVELVRRLSFLQHAFSVIENYEMIILIMIDYARDDKLDKSNYTKERSRVQDLIAFLHMMVALFVQDELTKDHIACFKDLMDNTLEEHHELWLKKLHDDHHLGDIDSAVIGSWYRHYDKRLNAIRPKQHIQARGQSSVLVHYDDSGFYDDGSF